MENNQIELFKFDNNSENNKGKELFKIFNNLPAEEKQSFAFVVIEAQLKEANKILDRRNEELKTWDKITDIGHWFDMKDVADHLNYKGYGRNKIFAFLRDIDILCSTNANWNEPKRQYIEMGCFKSFPVVKNNIVTTKTLISTKGINYIRKKLDERIDEN